MQGSKGAVSWQHELPNELIYIMDQGNFHSFEGDHCLIGFQFSTEGEAAEFYRKVNKCRKQKKPSKREEKEKEKAIEKEKEREEKEKIQQQQQQSPTMPSSPTPSNTTSTKKSKRFSTRLSLGGSSSNNKDKESNGKNVIDKSLISAPKSDSFQHVSHLGFSSQSGFSMRGIDPSWQALLNQLNQKGFSQKDIEKHGDFIKEFVDNKGGPVNSNNNSNNNDTIKSAPPAKKPPPPPTGRRKQAPVID